MIRRWWMALPAVVGMLLATGCAEYKWEESFERAEQRAKAENKYLFVFYRWWLDSDSNRMMADVIQQPDVVRLFQNTVNACIVYEYPPNRQYMAKHGVDKAPGFLIKAPDGSFQKRTGYIPKDAFLQWAAAALTSQQGERLKPPPVVAPPPQVP